MEDKNIFICTVGGAPEPIVKSLDTYHPSHVVFVCSEQSKKFVSQIKEAAQWRGIEKEKTLLISDHENLVTCVRDMRKYLHDYLFETKIGFDADMLAEISGGTKCMVAALTLSMMDFKCTFSYVGGEERSKEQVGIVLNGKERVIKFENPWDALLINPLRAMADAFNKCQFAAALNYAATLKSNDNVYKNFYAAIYDIIKAFRDWDLFDYNAAKKAFKGGMQYLHQKKLPSSFEPELEKFENCQERSGKLYEESQHLKAFSDGKAALQEPQGLLYLQDLLANATRAARRGRYDDAVARLYSLVEKRVKIELAWLGIDNSRITQEQMAKMPAQFQSRYFPDSKGHYKLPLEASYQFLIAMQPDNELGQLYQRRKEELKKIQDTRNKSLLAHGFDPVKPEVYNKYFEIACEFLGIKQEEIFKFPLLEHRALLI